MPQLFDAFNLRAELQWKKHDLTKLVDELFKPTDPTEGAALNNTTETPSPSLLDSILPRLPPEGQAWLNGLNSFFKVDQ